MRQMKVGIVQPLLISVASASVVCVVLLAHTPKPIEMKEHSASPCVCPFDDRPAPVIAAPPRADASVPRKVFHFLKELGYGIGNMETPQVWDDIDEQRGLLVVDVGACDGSDWSIPASVKRGHTVLAFEPMPSNVERFMQTARSQGVEAKTRRLEINAPPRNWPLDGAGQIFLFQACVSNFSGTTLMYSENEMASVVPQDFYANANERRSHEVQTVRLDSIILNQDIHILKIDTQGNELAVLRGASRLLAENRINIIELEFWPQGMEAGGVRTLDVLDYLHQHGFICFDYSRNRHIPPNRASDFEGFVASFDRQLGQGFGAWDELICFNHKK
jgi:FkbM family methyltransferase